MSQGPFPLIPRQKKTAAAFEMSHQKRREKAGKGKCDRRRGAKRDIFCPHKMEREKDLDEEKFSLLEVPIYPTKISTLLFGKCCSIFRRESRMRHVCIPPSLSPFFLCHKSPLSASEATSPFSSVFRALKFQIKLGEADGRLQHPIHSSPSPPLFSLLNPGWARCG